MIWIAPSERDQDTDTLEKPLWAAAHQLRANSSLTAQQYSQPVLGLIFLRFAEVRLAARRSELEKGAASGRRGSRVEEPNAYHAEGVLYLSPTARFDCLLALAEDEAVGKAATDAMRDIEKHNPSLSGVLPKTYEIHAADRGKGYAGVIFSDGTIRWRPVKDPTVVKLLKQPSP